MAHLNRDKISAIYFGLFNSNSWSALTAYKLTEDYLYADKSESYWSARFTNSGYIFSGDRLELDQNKFTEIASLLSQVPSDIFELKLPQNSEPGNKDEYTIFIQVDTKDGKVVQFKIDEYSNIDLTVDKRVLDFKDNIKAAIKKIQNS